MDYPRGSMYGIFTYMDSMDGWFSMVIVGKYAATLIVYVWMKM